MKAMVPKGPSMNEMLRQAQKMQADMEAKQAELEQKIYDVSAGGGAVSIKISGKKEITELKIAPELIDPDDPETLEDITIAAVNEAIKTVEDETAAEMQKITGPLGGFGGGMPGLF